MSVLWTHGALVEATAGLASAPFGVTGVSIDTRTLQPGDLFVALIGYGGDGHDHVAAAFAKGAAAALVHKPVAGVGPTLLVGDTLGALWAIAAAGRARFSGQCIAVTGSVGKTSTKEMLRALLSAVGPTHAAEGSHNNHWGVPLTLARLPATAAYAVIEIGMNHRGEIAPLARLARPHAALITAIGSTHIGQLGSVEAIAAEKASILRGLVPEGVAILPEQPGSLADWVPKGARVRRFGEGAICFARLLSCFGDLDGSDIRIALDAREFAVRLGAPGRHMAMNALAALAAADAVGADITLAAPALAGFGAVAGRGARRAILGGSVCLIDESYNAAPQSVRAALSLLRMARAERRIAVLGDMLELGSQGAALHAGLAEDVSVSADLLFAAGPLMRHLFDAVPAALQAGHAASAAELAPLVRAALRPGDALLVKGSNGSRMRDIIAWLEAT